MDRLLKYAGQQPFIRPRDLDRLHIPRNYLGRLVRAGKLERVGKGLYSSSENPPTENRTLVEVCRKVPQAVVCLSSALRFHELTTENPFEVWIALKQGAWTPSFEYPPIRVVRFSGPSLTFGAVEHTIEGAKSRSTARQKRSPTVSSSGRRLERNLRFKLFGSASARRRRRWTNSGKRRRFAGSPT
jgi:hypothetical protein